MQFYLTVSKSMAGDATPVPTQVELSNRRIAEAAAPLLNATKLIKAGFELPVFVLKFESSVLTSYIGH